MTSKEKKSNKRSLKERDDTIFAKDVKRWMLSGNNINITFKDGNELVGAIYEHRKDSEDKKAECFLCEDLTAEYKGDYFIVEVYNGKIYEIKFQSYDWLEDYIDKSYELEESKKSERKSLKEKLNDNGDVRFNDIYSCDLANVLTVTVYDKELYEKLREEDLVLYQKGVYEQIDWKSFQDEIGYLRDDIYASNDFDVKFTLLNGVLIIDVLDNTDKDVIMEYRLESKIVN